MRPHNFAFSSPLQQTNQSQLRKPHHHSTKCDPKLPLYSSLYSHNPTPLTPPKTEKQEHTVLTHKCAVNSISTSVPSGNWCTATHVLTGFGSLLKTFAYTSFIAAKSFMSVRKTLTLTTLSMDEPAAVRTAERFVRACSCFSFVSRDARSVLWDLCFVSWCVILEFCKVWVWAWYVRWQFADLRMKGMIDTYSSLLHTTLHKLHRHGIHPNRSRAVDHPITLDSLGEEGEWRWCLVGDYWFFGCHFDGWVWSKEYVWGQESWKMKDDLFLSLTFEGERAWWQLFAWSEYKKFMLLSVVILSEGRGV